MRVIVLHNIIYKKQLVVHHIKTYTSLLHIILKYYKFVITQKTNNNKNDTSKISTM